MELPHYYDSSGPGNDKMAFFNNQSQGDKALLFLDVITAHNESSRLDDI